VRKNEKSGFEREVVMATRGGRKKSG